MGSPLPHDPYKVLGVTKDASLANIRSAHRKLVLTCHPDKFPDDAVKAQKADEFHKVQQAYELLSDEQKRARYDQKIRLAELQADVLRESGNAKKAAGFYDHSPKTMRTGYWEPRREPVVEIRPKARYYDDSPREPPHPPPRPSPRYDDYDHHRSSSKRYEDMYDMPASSNASKKATPSRMYKDDTRSENPKPKASKWKEAADKFRVYEDKRRSRDKDRRQSYESKRYYAAPRVESESETESEVEEFMAPRRSTETKKRYEPVRRSRRAEDPRRRRTDDSESSDGAPEHKEIHNVASAAEYIMKSKSRAHKDERERPPMARSSTSRNAPPPSVPAPPSPPSISTVDSAKRSSARRGAVSSSKYPQKDRKVTEIVEPALPSKRAEYDSGRQRPNLPSMATAPLTSKGQPNPKDIPRAATFEPPRSSDKQPAMRRHHTSPLNVTSPIGHAPHKSSKLRETHDSGYSSPGTPDTPVPPKSYKTSTYKIVAEPDSDDSDVSRPTIVAIDPEVRRRGGREPSPRTQSHRYERPSVEPRASSRTTPTRNSTWHDERSPPPPRAPPNRSSTEREDGSGRRGHLFGEISSPERRGSDPRSPPAPGYKVNYSRQVSEDDIVYSEYPRRGRDDPRAKDRDAYAYERSGRNTHSPGLGSRTTSGRAEVSY